ncbi:rubredoxin [Chloroflexota bacterium]
MAVSINRQNLTCEFIMESKVLAVSILAQDTLLPFIGRFGFESGRKINKFEDVDYEIGETLAPVVIDNTLAYLEARVSQEVYVGTHTNFIAEVVGAEIMKEGAPMTYAYYQQVKRGTTPKTAPGYIGEEEAGVIKAPQYKCTVCGYVYDPELGDSVGGIKPQTPFEELPDDWVCPVCGANKSEFERRD